MKKYRAVIFDFDGTLANTYDGIFNSYAYAAENLGLAKPTAQLVDGAIGSALLDVFTDKFGLSADEAATATKIYRERYAEKGIYEVTLYDGMQDLLQSLRENLILTGIATLKLESFAKSMVENMDIGSYINTVRGIDANNKLTKAEILLICIEELGVSPSHAVLIGDSKYDAIGAHKAKVDFVGVTYGFGFKTKADLADYPAIASANSVCELQTILLGEKQSTLPHLL